MFAKRRLGCAARAAHADQHGCGAASAGLSDAAVQALRNHPLVEAIESDATVLVNEAALTPAANQSGATWGLDRIDQPSLPLSGTFEHDPAGGAGVSSTAARACGAGQWNPARPVPVSQDSADPRHGLIVRSSCPDRHPPLYPCLPNAS